jgi:hypothetical protein
MACALGLPELVNHNPFIKGLDEFGYQVDFVGGYFVIYGLPYLDQEGGLKYGDWASPLDLSGPVIDPPKEHQAWWRGGRPHDQSQRNLRLGGGSAQVTVAQDFVTDYSFSFKLHEDGQPRSYRSFEEKVETYLHAITAPAMAAYPDATPLRGIEIKAAAQGSPLRFPDTMSARYHMNDISSGSEAPAPIFSISSRERISSGSRCSIMTKCTSIRSFECRDSFRARSAASRLMP